MIDLDGKRVVITGAGGGLGRALCTSFDAAGAMLVGCDIEAEAVPRFCTEAHGFDLRDDEALATAARSILDGGIPDVVISNAGWTRAETLGATDPANFDDELARNLGGAAKLSLSFLPHMRRDRADRNFIFIASINALAHFGNPAYSAAKSGILAWMRAIATEAGRDGVRSNAIIPSPDGRITG